MQQMMVTRDLHDHDSLTGFHVGIAHVYLEGVHRSLNGQLEVPIQGFHSFGWR
jgi:hypothetical protein